MKKKRYHPLLILFRIGDFVKSYFILFIILFIVNAGSRSPMLTYGRYLFLLFFAIVMVYHFLKWYTHKYALDESAFHLYRGIFNKTERTIPFSKIQNINRHTSFFHRIFHVTSVSFETGISGDEAAVLFEVITRKEAERIIDIVQNDKRKTFEPDAEEKEKERVVHFKPTRKDTLKASFTSLSPLAVIPIFFSFYSNVDDIVDIDKKARGMLSYIISSWWIVSGIVLFVALIAVIFGMARTFLKYGKYEISSDDERIYITKGVIEETSFFIEKHKVQAVEVEQSLLKRLLGLAEVKLTSAGRLDFEGEKLELNSLYPFLPVKRAYEIINEILPDYEVAQEMRQLPKKSLWVRLLAPSWIWIIATVVLYFWKPEIFGLRVPWWLLSAFLFVSILVARWIGYLHTKYVLNDRFIQLQSGIFTTSLFLSKREKVIEVRVSRNFFQKWLGLASIETINRAKPIQFNGVKDVPTEFAWMFYKWYMGRGKEVKVE
ncbi:MULTISPECIES: PH domain-containing protein [Heyndrickxia]|uniref:PH domain-containing protein n=1 Tax=Heyndrickxia coagulans TaxID=1398 RepID=A0AAW7CM69_HEYCO|nr:PH domain-containing protein [Heyndrickxia faecalis]MDL5042187.1 PH domain-containing protein [Heyndrickxia coagulans]